MNGVLAIGLIVYLTPIIIVCKFQAKSVSPSLYCVVDMLPVLYSVGNLIISNIKNPQYKLLRLYCSVQLFTVYSTTCLIEYNCTVHICMIHPIW